jgi:hypothetical protein
VELRHRRSFSSASLTCPCLPPPCPTIRSL